MYTAVNNPIARVALAILDILIGVSLAALSIFSIAYCGRAIYRMANKKDVWTGLPEEKFKIPVAS